MIEFLVAGQVRVRATAPAIRRALAGPLAWSAPIHRSRVGMVGAAAVAKAKTVGDRGTLLRMDGFEFWTHNSILGREGWSTVRRFDLAFDARKFAGRVIDAARALPEV